MNQLTSDIRSLKSEAGERISKLASPDELREFKVLYLGKRGKVTELLKKLGTLSGEERPAAGKEINRLKQMLEEKLDLLLPELEKKSETLKMQGEWVDITLPARMISSGKIHPITKTFYELIEVFTGMGFSVYDGPEIETVFYNFDALNHTESHPARDEKDTFYIDDEKLLRTHTSPVQIRVMQQKKPPVFMICPGSVYRRDTPDLTHSPKFHQVEGLMVDTAITFGDLKGVLTEFIHKVFGEKTAVRFRPSFFPFTEPSAELDIECAMCGGKGCRVCKNTGWIEVLGSGMVDPNVFMAVGYDPDKYSGFAFGMGVERIAMLKYNISDIRLFYENNIKFLEQF